MKNGDLGRHIKIIFREMAVINKSFRVHPIISGSLVLVEITALLAKKPFLLHVTTYKPII